jgi:lipopolysaccharide transport system ATP-binding protein
MGYKITSSQTPKNVVCSVAFRDEYDNYCWLVRSTFDGIELSLNSGTTIECSIEDFALAPGTYRADIFLSERDNEVLDFIESAFAVTVEVGHFFQTGSPGLPSHCKVLTRSRWEVR